MVVSPNLDACSLMDRLAELKRPEGRLLLDRIARGELRQAERRWDRGADRASARGCALLAQVGYDHPRALAGAKAWQPMGDVDRATQRAVFFLAGEESLDGTVLGVPSNAVADHVLKWFRSTPTRERIGLLVRVAVASRDDYAVSRVERVLEQLAGARLAFPWNASTDQHVAALRDWWTAHAATWPSAAVPPSGSP